MKKGSREPTSPGATALNRNRMTRCCFLTFAAAKETSEFGILSKQRIHTYLSAAYGAIEGVNALKSGSAKKHGSKGTGEG